jgi:hypothetical protein
VNTGNFAHALADIGVALSTILLKNLSGMKWV